MEEDVLVQFLGPAVWDSQRAFDDKMLDIEVFTRRYDHEKSKVQAMQKVAYYCASLNTVRGL